MKTLFTMPETLATDECDRIIVEARKLTAEIGLRSEGTEEFNALISDFGCCIEKGQIRFPVEVVNKVFDRIAQEAQSVQPKRRTVADLPCMDYHEDEDYFGFSVTGQAGLICDVEGRIRPCLKDDLARFSRLVDEFERVEWGHPCMIPQDAPPRTREIHAYATIAMNNRKPRLVSAYSKEAVAYFMEISEISYGSREQAKKNAPFVHSLWINSPFTLARDVVEGAMEVRRVLGRPFKVVTMPVAGASAPVTTAGSLVLGTAEVIMANAITLAVDDRLNGYFSAPLAMDVRQGTIMVGPETDRFKLASVSIARKMFQNDRHVFQSFSLGTMAKTPGAQSMMEKSLSGMLALSCGARMFGAMSTLAFSDVISPVQFLLDLELGRSLEEINRGIQVDDNTLASDVIKRIAPTGANFLTDDHTLDNYAAEQWLPMFIDRQGAMAAKDNPREMLDNATDKARELWDNAPNKCPLTENQKREISKVLDAADQALA